MLIATQPYWLSVATETALVEVGVALPEALTWPMLELVERHDATITPAERLVRSWTLRPVARPVRTAEELYEEMAGWQGMELAGTLRNMARELDRQAVECAEPQAWHIGYVAAVPYKIGEDPHRGAVAHSCCLLAPAWKIQQVHAYFKALTSMGHIPASGSAACYGFCLQRQMDEDFIAPEEIASTLKNRLTPLLRSQSLAFGPVSLQAIDAFDADVQALVLSSSTATAQGHGVGARRL